MITGQDVHRYNRCAAVDLHVLINTDGQAKMVAKAGYTVVADLHRVIPAVIDEIQRRAGK